MMNSLTCFSQIQKEQANPTTSQTKFSGLQSKMFTNHVAVNDISLAHTRVLLMIAAKSYNQRSLRYKILPFADFYKLIPN
jgi:hypothetical protein